MGKESLAGDQYHHGNLRAALLDSALVVLTEKGVAGFSTREAARRAGVSQSALNITSVMRAGSSVRSRPVRTGSSAIGSNHSNLPGSMRESASGASLRSMSPSRARTVPCST